MDLVVQRPRDTEAALKLLRRLLRNQPVAPEKIVTNGLGSYSALDQLFLRHLQMRAGCERTIGRRTLTCRSDDESASSSCSNPKPQPQRFLTTHAAIYNTRYTQRHLVSRATLRRFRAGAEAAWAAATSYVFIGLGRYGRPPLT